MAKRQPAMLYCRRCYSPLGHVERSGGAQRLVLYVPLYGTSRPVAELEGRGRAFCWNCGEVRTWYTANLNESSST